MTTSFDFLQAEFPEIHAEARKAWTAALADPRTSCFYSRRVVELSVRWAFEHDRSLRMPYDDKVSSMLHDPSFKQVAGDKVFRLAKEANRFGNQAVHRSGAVTQRDSIAALSALFQFCYWFARTYNRRAKPAAGLTFDPKYLPNPQQRAARTQAQIEQLEADFAASDAERRRLEAELTSRADLEAELTTLRAEVAEAKARALAIPDDHDYSEAETRDFFLDLLLAEAGWTLDDERDREVKVTGMPDGKDGFVDYVLWGDDGRPVALVEAKRTRRDPRVGQQQAHLYADRLEAQFGQRPIIFYSNGYEHWIWDDQAYPPRPVQGFYKKAEIELLIQRRTSRASLAETEIDPRIVERYYQTRAIRRIGEAFEADRERKALVVMATGAGKTRTVIALADLLIRANWAKRVLFLADRTALVNQAVNAFKQHLPDSSPVNLVTDRHEEGRVYVSTYPTMMNLINAEPEGERRFGVGHFDLVVIDEAHRSVFSKYQAIFDYFDSLLVGLTATPRDEIDRNTYGLFDLEDGVPTDAYGLSDAVADGYLVPPRAVSVPLKFQRQGIDYYDDLSDEDRALWDELDWDEDDPDPPDRVEADAINKWLFNADTVDKVLENLMTRGVKVAGGDRLGKTIIFARSQDHADFISKRFDINYPHHKGSFARVITHRTEFGQSLIDQFSIKDGPPYIAVSVNMLDTGIDIPEVVNLVFFKIVRSKTMFWQMLGRGTRLCPDLFGPGDDKQFFQVFDYCQNFEYFGQNPDATDGTVMPSLSARLFTNRLDLVAALQRDGDEDVLGGTVDLLWRGVVAINLDNFVARPHRRLVERFRDRDAWTPLQVEDHAELAASVSDLPTSLPAEPEEAKRFDLLVLNVQLALIRAEPTYPALRDRVRQIAGLLEEYPSIPAVAKELELIVDVQSDEWWDGVTLPMLESVRRRLRGLVGFIEKRKRKIVYTDFEDEIGEHVDIEIDGLAPLSDIERFRRKTRAFLLEHGGELAIEKVRRNRPITAEDLAELERILIASGAGSADDIERARAEAGGFGLFIRSLVGLDRAAAKEAFAEFLDASTHSASQIEFVNLLIDDLSRHGVIDAGRFYESPYTDLAPRGPDDLFAPADLDRLLQALDDVRARAAVA